MTISVGRILEAAGIVLVTTLDDAVWLVPFVVRRRRSSVAWLHATLFVVTLESMALVITLFTTFLVDGLPVSDTVLTTLGVLLCWSLTGILWYRSLRKRRFRHQRQQDEREDDTDDTERQQQQPSYHANSEVDPLVTPTTGVPPTTRETLEEEDDGSDDHDTSAPRPWMVISLTFLGSLDEISYFPSLLLAGVFDGVELCLGTLLAALVMIVVVVVFLRPCQPLMKRLDVIPLYGIMGMFAVLLTAELVWDVWTPGDDDDDDG